jgi:hypothetical protein
MAAGLTMVWRETRRKPVILPPDVESGVAERIR